MEAGALHAPAGLSRISIGSPLLRLRSDEQLVAAFRAGNDDAFQVIFDRYRQRLFAYTRQMLGGSRQDAEDALQDVFLRAYGALRASDRPVSLRAWLYRVAHNRCIDQLRRPAPAQADVFDLSRTPLRDPIEESARREDLRRLVEDVQRLPDAQRSALLMREMDGLSYQELADALDVTVPAVKSLLVRARIGLVEAIEARDTACAEIRTDLMASYDKGVRASGKARRHLRDCAGCRQYRTDLRAVQRGFGALAPSHGPLGALLKLFGLGSGAGGAAAGGGAVLGGGGAATVVGGSAATATACKVAVVVCSAALVTGAAGDLEHVVKRAVSPVMSSSHPAAAASKSPPAAAVHVAAAPHVSLTRSPLERLVAPPSAKKAPSAPASAAAAQAAEVRRLRAKAEPSAAVADDQARRQAITPDDEVYASANAEDPVTKPAPATNVTGGAVAPSAAPNEAAPPAPASVTPAPTSTATPPPTTTTGAGTAPATPSATGATVTATGAAATPTTAPTAAASVVSPTTSGATTATATTATTGTAAP
jgi:RNA polymerase sigma factor (sigma-70 family)